MDPAYPGGYSDRARAFQKVADGILEVRGIRPYYSLIGSDSELEGKPVRYGSAELGICIKQETPDLDFAAEVLWLYGQAVKDYKQVLSLDPTNTTCYTGVSNVLRQLGNKNEVADYLNRALAILNKAIIADEHDERSYSERAQVFEELGKIELAISDLERLLTLSTSKFDLDLTRWKIEELRKRKAVREA
jgi:tetratricopeptide (TPR) repeat protein